MIDVDSHESGANFFDRDAQFFHFIISGGSTVTLKTVQTLVLELGVMTELTDDEFYDNGNLANNLAALLGIDKSKIRFSQNSQLYSRLSEILNIQRSFRLKNVNPYLYMKN